ncbi:Ig-like domain-containing protein [Flavobacteriaceae bacterium XHP0103]|uniref:Ig-like domain-containing protein n=1 Tax=Marixanthotalea marina TaxID=2844359 RepID=UPI00298A0106|nr:Ig-like domain-containing protein [Marixanthotalea marina]MBU3821261.1 Ig-like domain-containing protein [Marixanthotalea marina]
MKLNFTYLLVLGLLSMIFIDENNDEFTLITKETQFEAGKNIELEFSGSNQEKPTLYISNSYGSSIIKPTLKLDVLGYKLPRAICERTGVIYWKLLSGSNKLSGKLSIYPKLEVATMETYLGPPSIEAGETDYSMLVVIPTDVYDNPLPDSTKVIVKHQFLGNLSEDVVLTRNRISFKNIYSKTISGRILVASECLDKDSKEYTIDVMPAIPTNFTISYQQNHNYADGNQITTFSTSIIKDRYGNIVSDGTYVQFFITNNSNNILKTSGTTINGIATAKMIHPDHEDNWIIKAYVEGIAESNEISLFYKKVIEDFEVVFSEDNRKITIGPLKSFMNQMIPDGMEISLSIYENDKKIKTLYKSSYEGFATFKLNANDFPNNMYRLKIKVAGVGKTYSRIKL